jgi:transcriptional regulator with XRE-family HTH domain
MDSPTPSNSNKAPKGKHPVDLHVGKRLRHRRWMIGMTQQQLAGAVGIKFQQIQKYESGANRVSASRLWDLAQALSVPVSFFFEGLDEQAAEPDDALSPDLLGDKETLELVRAYYALDEEPRRRLLELTKALTVPGDDGQTEAA